MRSTSLVLLALSACGGSAFSSDLPSVADSETAPFEAALPDAGVEAGPTPTPDAAPDAGHKPPDAGTPDTTPDAAPDVAPDAPSTCTPYVWANPADGSTQGPYHGCPVQEAPNELTPGSYAVQNQNSPGCFLATTPLACRCAETYSCACLLANPNTFCTGKKLVACDDSAGGPVVTCN